MPALATAGEPAQSVADIFAHDGLEFFRKTVDSPIRSHKSHLHDNSAKTIEEAVQQYARFFGVPGLTLTEQDQKDLVAYMKLMQWVERGWN